MARVASHRPARTALLSTALLVLSFSSCLTTQSDAQVIQTAERTLRVSDGVYAAAMQWYFTPANALRLSVPQRAIFERLRWGYDPAYKAVQEAINARKAGKAGDIAAELAALERLLNDVDVIVAQLTGPRPSTP